MTKREQERYDALQEQLEELEGEASEIENALDYLRAYTDY
jgi:predicted nuclease with TOPRIM domain